MNGAWSGWSEEQVSWKNNLLQIRIDLFSPRSFFLMWFFFIFWSVFKEVVGPPWAQQLPWASCSPICLAGSAKATSFCSLFRYFSGLFIQPVTLTDEVTSCLDKEQACLLFVIKTMDFPNSEFSTMMQTHYVCSITHYPPPPPQDLGARVWGRYTDISIFMMLIVP